MRPRAFRNRFEPRKPRHRLLKFALGLLAVALLAVLLVFGVLVGAAMLLGGLLLRAWRQRQRPIARPARVVEGEYRVVAKPALHAGG